MIPADDRRTAIAFYIFGKTFPSLRKIKSSSLEAKRFINVREDEKPVMADQEDVGTFDELTGTLTRSLPRQLTITTNPNRTTTPLSPPPCRAYSASLETN